MQIRHSIYRRGVWLIVLVLLGISLCAGAAAGLSQRLESLNQTQWVISSHGELIAITRSPDGEPLARSVLPAGTAARILRWVVRVLPHEGG